MQRRYYIMGVVGVGKSTLRDELARRLPQASIYEEWPETMTAQVGQSMDAHSEDDIADIQSWIFEQLARKNQLINADPAELFVIDRSPLDTFAFYRPELWQERAQQMMAATSAEALSSTHAHTSTIPERSVQHEAKGSHMSATPASGELLFLHGDPVTIHRRMDASRVYTVNAIAAQQSAFELLLYWLQRNFGYIARRIDTCGLSPDQVADGALNLISAREARLGGTGEILRYAEECEGSKQDSMDYSPLDINAVVQRIAQGLLRV
ncbi:MAG: ATP-binding protein [Coriobacteriia bacterium]|nr:ATP-binding protein [Coriobacteriia bacterium]MCL2606675.1 ATP-binding protein [Coriobacteriia bacterium]